MKSEARATPGRGAHEGLANQEGVHLGGAHALHIGRAEDAGLGDQQAVRWHAGSRPSVVSSVTKGAEVAVVDADQRGRFESQRTVKLGAVVHLDEHVQAQGHGSGFEVGHLRRQAGGNEQDAIGPHGTGFHHLVLIDHEVLAQHRQLAGRTGLLQVGDRALEEALVGQHTQAGRAVARVAVGDLGGAEVRAQDALAGAGLLDLGDHAGAAGGDGAAQEASKKPAAGHGGSRPLRARR